RVTPKFINLDMEEYRDLDLTVTAFREVLDEPEFLPLSAGIVLQAYLPDSFRAQCALTEWARGRRARGGAPIKLRIVKGANLAMERIEAAIHGWPQAPYETKVEVDANYTRMLEYGCRPEHAEAVHLGVASHNLFDIAYGFVLRETHGVQRWVEFEMLEGMANHQARAVRERAGGLLLYAPVVRAEDFHSAIAYLVRRLDENTAPENFLRHVFDLEPGSPAWIAERDRFLAAFHRRAGLSDAPRRTQDRRQDAAAPRLAWTVRTRFENDPETDWTLAANRAWIAEIHRRWRTHTLEAVALVIDGVAEPGATEGAKRDPSHPARIAYRFALAGRAQVDRALDIARTAQPAWVARGTEERAAVLEACAAELGRRRGELIGAMMLDGAKTATEADVEVSEAVDFAHYYARSLRQTWDELHECRGEPLGVVVVAPPWNFPLSIPAGGVLAALAAGNTVVLKPALEAVLVGRGLADCLWNAGVPGKVLQFLPCPEDEIGRGLVTDPRVGGVILTGSVETARLFLGWRPDLPLFAETSGKNAIIVTALADRDQTIRDLVRSAFGHNGQKCSAASLAICEAEVYEDADFRRQLRDAAASLAVGSAWEPTSRVTPLTQPPGAALRRAFTVLDAGEEWLLEPRESADNPQLWSPGIKLGVRPGSFFHRTECFGPVLGLMRAENLDEAIELANAQPFGLTSGIQTLDDREITRWVDRVEAGNLYVNRPVTGAIVGRQPFGGWKASSVGPGAKAGGPNYVLQLARWHQVALPLLPRDVLPEPAASLLERCLAVLPDPDTHALLTASAASYVHAWRAHFGREHDPSAIRGERNAFRYRPCRSVIVRGTTGAHLCQIALAACVTGTPLTVSLSSDARPWAWLADLPGVELVVEAEAGFAERLAHRGDAERVRAWERISTAARAAANAAGVTVIDVPVLATGRLELRWYLREQTVSRTLHRYGNVIEPAVTE
ncbi:MAG TPA: bifunctional proline dehydrogenase/L-glutamate gamma-semialdehyde dehydrogenase, partial [Dongiaceae bacterium]|nr:bifunctional proline dehydrogenase/L-glutamate gamma-semialdehyde dehydrogenase [Dongiaceae bacterium]